MGKERIEGGGEARRADSDARWDARRVRRLRGHLGETQAAFAARLGGRQQTVSEWETGASRPRGMSRRLLHMISEQHGFYSTEGVEGEAGGDDGGGERDAGGARSDG